MLIPLIHLVSKYNIKFTGILHVGAHECEEIRVYEMYVPRNRILWVEGLEDKVALCRQRIPNLLIEEAVVSDKCETVTFHRSNNGQSSSILELGTHTKLHPNIWYIATKKVETKMLRDILPKYNNIRFNFLNFDIQGVELKALKGMSEYLPKVDYVYIEVSNNYVYKDCALIGEIDEYLKQYGLERVETKWSEKIECGDAFYIRK
jgi:FkbM family methyltransferase